MRANARRHLLGFVALNTSQRITFHDDFVIACRLNTGLTPNTTTALYAVCANTPKCEYVCDILRLKMRR